MDSSTPSKSTAYSWVILISVFVALLIASASLYNIVGHYVHQEQTAQFTNQTSQITSFIQNRMDEYTQVMYGAQGLFAASHSVEANEWQAYVNQLNVLTNYKGLSSISYLERVPAAATSTYPYVIFPASNKSEYFPVTYFVSFASTTSSSTQYLGLDIDFEAKRHAALTKARDENSAVATPIISAYSTGVAIFSLYAPIYTNGMPHTTLDERRAALSGYVFAGFQITPLFTSLKTDPVFDPNIHLSIYDADDSGAASTSTLLYTNSSGSLTRSSVTRTSHITVGERVWTIVYDALPTYQTESVDTYLPLLVVGISLAFDFLIVWLLYSFLRGRQRAIAYAEVLTKDLRESKDVLAEAKATAEAILFGIGDGLLATDAEGRAVFVNYAFTNMLGLTEDEVRGKPIEEVMPVYDSTGKTFAKGEIYVHEALTNPTQKPRRNEHTTLYMKNAIGKAFPVSISISSIVRDGNVIGLVSIFRDVTIEKEVDKAKTEFVSLASHQLRTPLTAIKWYSEMLLGGDAGVLTTEQKSYLDEIHHGNERMVDLVNALLNVSRLDLGKFAVDPEPVHILDLAKSVLEEQQSQVDARKIHLTTELHLPEANVITDPKLLRMVFQNLLSNAVKYTPEGGSVTFSISSDSAHTWLLKVSDTGYGIPDAQKDKIFQKLFRADNVKEMDTEGTGLGLYIVKSIVEKLGGTIRFDSVQDNGTTFFVEFSRKDVVKNTGLKSLG